MAEKIENCQSCKFFGPEDGGQPQGRCRAHPPTAVLVVTAEGTAQMGIYPPTANTNLCGEWQKGTIVKIAKNLPPAPLDFPDPNAKN